MTVQSALVNPKVMILFGAGVSVPLGIPTMRELYADFLQTGKSGITGSERHALKYFSEKLEIQPDLEEFLIASNMLLELDRLGFNAYIEKAVSHHSTGIRIEKYRERFQQRKQKILALRSRALDYLFKLCFKFDRGAAVDIFGNFVQAIADMGYPLFTTNYDFALEHVAAEKGIQIEDNFVPQGLRRVWNPAVQFPAGNALTLVQVHGSVTWYADEQGAVEKIRNPTDMNSMGANVEKKLIFPTRPKGVYDPHFFPLYAHFLTVLSRAELLLVSGHSLRDDYLRAGVLHELRKGEIRIVFVDPEFPKQLSHELKPAGSIAGQITHVPRKFEECADQLADAIKRIEISEIPDHCAEFA